MQFVTKAAQYIDDVLNGDVIACRLVRLACQRQLDDLKRQNTKDFPFMFDVSAAERVCRFMTRMPHVKGEWAQRNECLNLEPWQCFILTTVFGWVHNGKGRDSLGRTIPSGIRRFRVVYQETARKNAKTTQGAGILNYMLAVDEDQGKEVHSAACTRKQAGLSFNVAKAMAKKAKNFTDHFGLKVMTHRLIQEETNSYMEPLHAEGETLDGLNGSFYLVDELHAHPTDKVYRVLDDSTGSRLSSLIWSITTAGFSTDGICYEIRDYALKVLEGTIDDDTFFGIIYTLDEEDLEDENWTNPDCWIKANPNLGVSVYPLDMERACRSAKQTPTAQVNFKTKRLNVWCGSEQAWMNMLRWNANADHDLCLESFAGQSCWIGLDLASKIDIAALLMVFRHGDGFAAFGKFYLPEDTVKESMNARLYGVWNEQGLLTVTPGAVTDFGYIKQDIESALQEYDVRGVGYDPFQATQLATELQEEGVLMVEVRPTVLNFSEAMKEVEAKVLTGQLTHDGNECLAWQISNVHVQEDRKGNIYPRRPGTNTTGTGTSGRHKKIDGAVALIMAMKLAMADEDQNSSIYDTRGVVAI